MSNEQTDKEIRDRLQSVFPNPQIASRVIDLVTATKPEGWSRRSNPPYYKEKYAMQMKEYVDRMIDLKGDIVFNYKDWEDNGGNTKSTLYARVSQSIRYLIDHLDTIEGKYRNWYDIVRVETKYDSGNKLRIAFLPGTSGGTKDQAFNPEIVEPPQNMPVWKVRMEDWIESDSAAPFVQEGLILSAEQVAEIKKDLKEIPTLAASVNNNSIKIIRVNI